MHAALELNTRPKCSTKNVQSYNLKFQNMQEAKYRFHVFDAIIAQIRMLNKLLPLHHTLIWIDQL